MQAAFYGGMGVGASFLGAAADGGACCFGEGLGRRRVVLLSMLLSTLGAILAAAMPSIAALLPALVIVGAGVGGVRATAYGKDVGDICFFKYISFPIY